VPDSTVDQVSGTVTSAPSTRFQRIFCNQQFFKLWLAQVASATGDWIGFLAIAALAARIGAGNAGQAVGVVMIARVAPGFFLASLGGVLVDRWDRKKVMVVCDIGRAATLALLPFIHTVWGLVLASLVMECFTLMWSPAKEASVPNLVPDEFLTNANSLSLAAAYGTFPVGAGLFALLAKVAEWLSSVPGLESLKLNQEATGFYFDMLTFLISALLISRLVLPHLTRRASENGDTKRIDWAQAYHEIKEGWGYIFQTPLISAVLLGLCTALLGGGMVVPIGPLFSRDVTGSGAAGFGVLTVGLGCGVAAGVAALSVVQNRVNRVRTFELSLGAGGVALIVAASMSSLTLATIGIAAVGICAGGVYVIGFTLLQENTTNDLRGRIFSAVYTLVRLSILVSFAVAGFLADGLGSLSDHLVHGKVGVKQAHYSLQGARLALWFAGLLVLGGFAGVVKAMRRARRAGSERGPGSAVADMDPA
jgi:dTMP kinase